MKRALLVCLTLAMVAAGSEAAEGKRYRAEVFAPNTRLVALNRHGDVVGVETLPDGKNFVGFVLQCGIRTNLGSLGGGYTEPTGLNDDGTVIGSSRLADAGTLPIRRAFVYSAGEMKRLVARGASGEELEFFDATLISASGAIVAYSTERPGKHYVIREGRAVPMEAPAEFSTRDDRASLEGGFFSDEVGVMGMLNAPPLVGAPEPRTRRFHGFVWTDGKIEILPDFFPTGVNASGRMIGGVLMAPLKAQAGLRFHGQVQLAGIPDKFETSMFSGINASGQIVGSARTVRKTSDYGLSIEGAPYLYENGVWMRLNDLVDFGTQTGVKLSRASAINDRGQILCNGTMAGAGQVGVLLTPVSEGSSAIGLRAQ